MIKFKNTFIACAFSDAPGFPTIRLYGGNDMYHINIHQYDIQKGIQKVDGLLFQTLQEAHYDFRMRLENLECKSAVIDKVDMGEIEIPEKEGMEISDDEMTVANALHEKMCRWNHTDGCSYHYEKWSNPGHAKSKYLKKAQAMLAKADVKTVLALIEEM